ncbi:MAG: hypothetical protein AAGF66_06175 [Cyanobacteria bacterium P01_H01_bin.119]
MADAEILTLTGTVERSTLGLGAWSLITPEQTYEIDQASAPEGLLAAQQPVAVKGRLRPDVMTTAMIGPVIEVLSFQLT